MPASAPQPPRDQLRFSLPPSLGALAAGDRARKLETLLQSELGTRVAISVAASYEALAKDLLAGRTDAAWAPPFVCARVEAMGVRVLVRGIRSGASTYRGALVARAKDALTVETLGGKKAIWADRDSVAGYLLVMALLRGRGLEPTKVFGGQTFAGSYKAAVDAVLAGQADVTSVFAPAGADDAPTGLAQLVPGREQELAVLAFTDEAPNDGVAVSMSMPAPLVAKVEKTFLGLQDSPEGAAVLKDLFNMERFEVAPRLGYRALYRVALASL